MKERFVAVCPKCFEAFEITSKTKWRKAEHADGIDLIECPNCGYTDDGW